MRGGCKSHYNESKLICAKHVLDIINDNLWSLRSYSGIVLKAS